MRNKRAWLNLGILAVLLGLGGAVALGAAQPSVANASTLRVPPPPPAATNL